MIVWPLVRILYAEDHPRSIILANSPGTTADSSRRGSNVFMKRNAPVLDSSLVKKVWLEEWLSAPRFECYLGAASGNDEIALELYLWNTGLAQAVLRDISFFEIALRNRYDRCLTQLALVDEHWLFDDTSPVRKPIMRKNKRGRVVDANELNRTQIDKLKKALGDSPDRIISNLTLGFWAHMTDTSHERDLWIPCVHKAWQKGVSRKAVNVEIAEINSLRNRAVHHERLFLLSDNRPAPTATSLQAVEMFFQLAPQAAEAVYGSSKESSAMRYVRENPMPCFVRV